jgi:general secretion pathway protein K
MEYPSRQGGIALVSVLWLLLLLAGLAATVAYVARVEAVLARRSLDLARARAAADAGIVNTISRVSDEQVSRRPQLGVTESWEFDSVPVSIEVSNEAGRIDVNSASDELLTAFFKAAGLPTEAASNLLRELRAKQGVASPLVRAPHEQAAFASRIPPTSPLGAIDELRRLPAWQTVNLDCWMDSLTVYSGQRDVSLVDAAPGALAAVQWLRTTDPDQSKDFKPLSVTRTANSRSLVGEVLRIRAVATIGDLSLTAQWIGRLTGDTARPTLTMYWDRSAPADSTTSCAYNAPS